MGRALEQPQRGEVVLGRVRGVVQVQHRNRDIGQHVAGNEDPAFLDQQRRMARGMCLTVWPESDRSLARQAISWPSTLALAHISLDISNTYSYTEGPRLQACTAPRKAEQ